MQTNSIEWLLLLSLIHVLEGSRMLWESKEFAPLERTVKTILESCYEDDSSSNSILILGDLNESIQNSSVIRMNISAGAAIPIEESYGPSDFKASRVVLIENSLERLYSVLEEMGKQHWWNHMTAFLIIAKYQKGCEDFKDILNVAWSKQMVKSIYICPDSLNTSVLYTLNLMANYAPYPWERIKDLNVSNVFRQVFNQRISCRNLNFDKTRHVNGYEIEVMGQITSNLCLFSPNDCELQNFTNFRLEPLQSIIAALNARGRFKDVKHAAEVQKSLKNSEVDIVSTLSFLSSIPKGNCFLLTHIHGSLIGIVKLEPEVSTLHKILKLWSTLVLIAAAIALAFLLLILIIKNHDVGLGMLDVVRLLTYTSIQTSVRTHAFRIYFTTMLIFMVISNGVFQGKIAAFLTTREKVSAMGTMNELADLGYKMFNVGHHDEWLNEKCPKCNFERVAPRECIELVLNKTDHLCVMLEDLYHANSIPSELDHIPEVLLENAITYTCRLHWFLADHFNDGLSRLFQTGILNYLRGKLSDVSKGKRMAREVEWSSPQYRPIKLYKLMFAFQVLALGLSISIIVFIWESYWGKYRTTRKLSIVQLLQRD